MKKKFKFKPAPPFKTYQEEADFWDTTDSGSGFNFTKAVKAYSALKTVKEEKKDASLHIRLPKKVKTMLTKAAKSRRRKTADMARLLIEHGLSNFFQRKSNL